MEELMKKGYARKCESKGKDGKTKYVPHQGVLYPSKGKISVFSDCPSKYRGTLINKNSYSGSDLTSQLVQPVVFMANIKAMFYQLKVQEKQRSFL